MASSKSARKIGEVFRELGIEAPRTGDAANGLPAAVMLLATRLLELQERVEVLEGKKPERGIGQRLIDAVLVRK